MIVMLEHYAGKPPGDDDFCSFLSHILLFTLAGYIGYRY